MLFREAHPLCKHQALEYLICYSGLKIMPSLPSSGDILHWPSVPLSAVQPSSPPLNSQLLSAPISALQLRYQAGLKAAPGEAFHQNDASLVQTSPIHFSGLRLRMSDSIWWGCAEEQDFGKGVCVYV